MGLCQRHEVEFVVTVVPPSLVMTVAGDDLEFEENHIFTFLGKKCQTES